MAGAKSGTNLIALTWDGFDKVYKVGGTVPLSGIYKCQNCGREITSNAHSQDNTFPPHNSTSSCQNAQWKAHILTDTNGNGFQNK